MLLKSLQPSKGEAPLVRTGMYFTEDSRLTLWVAALAERPSVTKPVDGGGGEAIMCMPCRLVKTWKVVALPLLYLALIVAGASLPGCAAGTGGGVSPAYFPQCMDPTRGLPSWQTHPCNLLNTGF